MTKTTAPTPDKPDSPPWHAKATEAVAKRLDADPRGGLSDPEVREGRRVTATTACWSRSGAVPGGCSSISSGVC